MRVPIISIVGKSNSGKTTFIEKLVKELTYRGYKIGTIKHDVHGFKLDHEGKDSYRHKASGAVTAIISGPNQIGMVKDVKQELNIDDIARNYLNDVDLILTEGYKKENKQKIEIIKKEISTESLCTSDDRVLAVISDFDININDSPGYDFENIKEVVDLLEQKVLFPRNKPQIEIYIDGKHLPMKEFVQDIVKTTILGMLSTLRGVPEKPNTIHINIEGSEK